MLQVVNSRDIITWMSRRLSFFFRALTLLSSLGAIMMLFVELKSKSSRVASKSSQIESILEDTIQPLRGGPGLIGDRVGYTARSSRTKDVITLVACIPHVLSKLCPCAATPHILSDARAEVQEP